MSDLRAMVESGNYTAGASVRIPIATTDGVQAITIDSNDVERLAKAGIGERPEDIDFYNTEVYDGNSRDVAIGEYLEGAWRGDLKQYGDYVSSEPVTLDGYDDYYYIRASTIDNNGNYYMLPASNEFRDGEEWRVTPDYLINLASEEHNLVRRANNNLHLYDNEVKNTLDFIGNPEYMLAEINSIDDFKLEGSDDPVMVAPIKNGNTVELNSTWWQGRYNSFSDDDGYYMKTMKPVEISNVTVNGDRLTIEGSFNVLDPTTGKVSKVKAVTDFTGINNNEEDKASIAELKKNHHYYPPSYENGMFNWRGPDRWTITESIPVENPSFTLGWHSRENLRYILMMNGNIDARWSSKTKKQ